MELNNTDVSSSLGLQKSDQNESLPPTTKTRSVSVSARKKLVAQVVPTDSLTTLDVARMYQLFSEYYDGHSLAEFKRDLFEKNDVILLRDAKTGQLQGFSTLLVKELESEGTRKVFGIFSGDTVTAQEYWGSPALGIAFLKYLWKFKAKNPLNRVYWFLMSKGYKTYLLMANNFAVHYPRFEKATPHDFKKRLDDFYSSRFGSKYSAETGLLQLQGPSCRLRDNVAALTPELLSIERVKFFAEKNPTWNRGTELCCIAEMTLWMPFKYTLKKFFRGPKKGIS